MILLPILAYLKVYLNGVEITRNASIFVIVYILKNKHLGSRRRVYAAPNFKFMNIKYN